MPQLRAAIRARQKLRLTYRTEGATTARTIRPLLLEYRGRAWTVTCQCDLRNDFRVFRPDRIETLTPLAEYLTPEPGKTIKDYEARLSASD